MKLGPAWWFHDSLEGMMRFRKMVTETAGFYNTVGFNDDTRAFLSIPARHDLARRVDSNYLGELVAKHIISINEALIVAKDLTYNLVKKAYKLIMEITEMDKQKFKEQILSYGSRNNIPQKKYLFGKEEIEVYPKSVRESEDVIFFIAREKKKKYLYSIL